MEEEVGPGGRHARRFEQLGRDYEGFKVLMEPYYSTDKDERLTDDPELKAKIESALRSHQMFGKEFSEEIPEEYTVRVSREDYAKFLESQKGATAATSGHEKKQPATVGAPSGPIMPEPKKN
jgi:hypothetical protein